MRSHDRTSCHVTVCARSFGGRVEGFAESPHAIVSSVLIFLACLSTNTPMAFQTTCQRVLAIPELIDSIFSYGDREVNLQCALVCRSWSNFALDALWKDIDDLFPILSILCPLVREDPELPYYDGQDWVRSNTCSLHHSLNLRSTVFRTFTNRDPMVKFHEIRTSCSIFEI